jgi:hypothetical protein
LLRVYDLKYGSGIPVEVENNRQLLYYGLGAVLTTEFKVSEVEIVIIQPRCHHVNGHIRRWNVDCITLLDFAADLVTAARRTEEPNAPLLPGKWCRFCPASGICPMLHENALAMAKLEFSPVVSYDPEKLSKALNWLPILEGWIKNVRDFAYKESLHGRNPPGWKLVAKKAMRKWKDENEVGQVILKDWEGRDALFTKKLKSVAQVEKIIPKASQFLIKNLIIKESSGTTLVQQSDSRDSLNLGAKNEFSKIITHTEF